MAISRPLLVALVAALVLLVATTALRVMGGGTDAEPPSSASTATAPSAAPSGATTAGAGGASGAASSSARAPQGGDAGGKLKARSTPGVPDRVARALDARKVVVLFFGARGSDDRATRHAARGIRGSDTAVFTDSVFHLDDYTRLVGALPLTQVPATVIVDRDRKARVIEGYADTGTLRQLVADAR